jgi:carbon starvation protein
VLFAVLTVIVIISALVAVVKAWRSNGLPTTEPEPVASQTYAPSGFIPTAEERALEQQWAELPADKVKVQVH